MGSGSGFAGTTVPAFLFLSGLMSRPPISALSPSPSRFHTATTGTLETLGSSLTLLPTPTVSPWLPCHCVFEDRAKILANQLMARCARGFSGGEGERELGPEAASVALYLPSVSYVLCASAICSHQTHPCVTKPTPRAFCKVYCSAVC